MRTARTLASAALALAAGGCLTFIEVPVETPIRPKIDASPFSRVYVAGFLPSGSEDVDTNLETVRLLRSQLKNKGGMRIIEADVLPLAEAARPVPGDGAAASQPAAVVDLAKGATIAEAEMLAMAGAPDVLLAYQPVGPKIRRLRALTRKYPKTTFSCLVDDATAAASIAEAFAGEHKPLSLIHI